MWVRGGRGGEGMGEGVKHKGLGQGRENGVFILCWTKCFCEVVSALFDINFQLLLKKRIYPFCYCTVIVQISCHSDPNHENNCVMLGSRRGGGTKHFTNIKLIHLDLKLGLNYVRIIFFLFLIVHVHEKKRKKKSCYEWIFGSSWIMIIMLLV